MTSNSTSLTRHITRRLPLFLVLLLAAALRFYRLDAQSFWNDEGNTARLVERAIPLILEGAAGDIHPPGYYLLLHLWRAVAGASEFALRAYSALVGVLTVAVTARVARRAAGHGGGHAARRRSGAWIVPIVAAALVAVHPLAVYYSQEARMYAQLGLVSALILWAATGLVTGASSPRAVLSPLRGEPEGGAVVLPTLALALAIAAGLYTQYTYVLALLGLNIAFGLTWLLHRRRAPATHLLHWIAAHALGGLLFLPWAPIALRATGWRPPDLAAGRALDAMTTALLAGVTLPGDLPWWAVAAAGVLMAAAVVVPALRLGRGASTASRLAGWGALGMAVVPPVMILAAGIYRPAYLKFLMMSVPPLAVALALPFGGVHLSLVRPTSHVGPQGEGNNPSGHPGGAHLWNIPDRGPFVRPTSHVGPQGEGNNPSGHPGGAHQKQVHPTQWLAFALLLPLLLVQLRALDHLYHDPAFTRDDYRGIAAQIRAQARPGDAILLNAPNQWEVFTYYYRGPLPVYAAPYRPTEAEAATWVQSIVAQHGAGAAEPLGGRLFVLYWGDTESDPGRLIARELAARAFKAQETWITSVRLARYGTGVPVTEPLPGLDGATFGAGEIRLTGYHLPATEFAPGDIVPLTLFWRAEQAPDARLKVFVHLVDAGGTLVAQVDAEPRDGFAPTTTWEPGDEIVDRYGIALPADLPPGPYTVLTGLYHLTGERLPATRPDGTTGDTVRIDVIPVAADAQR